MAIQYTLELGGIERGVVRTATPSDPVGSVIAVILSTNLMTVQPHAVSRISESITEIGQHFMDSELYGFRGDGFISGLAKDINGANGLITPVTDVISIGALDIGILLGVPITQVDDQIVFETIQTIRNYYLTIDGTQ